MGRRILYPSFPGMLSEGDTSVLTGNRGMETARAVHGEVPAGGFWSKPGAPLSSPAGSLRDMGRGWVCRSVTGVGLRPSVGRELTLGNACLYMKQGHFCASLSPRALQQGVHGKVFTLPSIWSTCESKLGATQTSLRCWQVLGRRASPLLCSGERIWTKPGPVQDAGNEAQVREGSHRGGGGGQKAQHSRRDPIPWTPQTLSKFY